MSVTMEPQLVEAVRQAASKRGQSVSSWIGGAAADRLLNERLGEALDAWEAKNGALAEEELRTADGRIAAAIDAGIRPSR